MSTEKDLEQDALIRQNAEHIRKNEKAIERQTECLEKIRDHYFPQKNAWKRMCGFFLKVVGAITIYTGMMEATEWYMNAREIEGLAEQSVAVAQRLMFEENDMAGAQKFLERAVELEGNKAKYRTMLGYVKGLAAAVDLFDIGRPLQPDERERVDAILAEALFLQTAAPDDPMPYVLTAQAYALRQEFALANEAIGKAVALAPNKAQVRCSGCAIRFFTQDFATARAEIEAAAKLQPDFPLVLYWKGMLAMTVDRDLAKAKEHFTAMVRRSPRLALPHAMLGLMLTMGEKPDVAAARDEFEKALAVSPNMKPVLLMMGETYEKEGNLVVARLWYDRALKCDGRFMKALLARARIYGSLGEWKAQTDDLTAAIALDPFRAELYDKRAQARATAGDAAGAAADRKMVAVLSRPNP